ncbi:MAG: 30S ribosomal protein S6 [Phycisphaerales bacterium]
MTPTRVYPYEAMFLVGQAAAADLSAVIAHVNEILSRAHAQVLALRKWDERRLAFEIKKQKRGLYLLAYFKAPNTSVAGIERDCNLSEVILRALILRADHYTEDEMRAADGREALEAEAKMRGKAPPPPVREAEPVGASAAPAGAAEPDDEA